MYRIKHTLSEEDILKIIDYLQNLSYWAQSRSEAQIRKSLQHSFCFACVNPTEEMLGFARVVTDYSTFAWIMDLFVLPSEQGKGVGKFLMKGIMAHPELQSIVRWGLATKDAHSLYTQYGFTSLKNPDFMMEKVNSAILKMYGE
jgi:GNAT superfamily N-acetyltransferase